MTDARIVIAVLSGETSKFSELVERYLPVVRAICGSCVYDPATQDDLIQESFIDSYTNLNRLRDGNKFGPWIAQIARNKCKTWIRGQKRKREIHEQLKAETPRAAANDPLSEATRKEVCEWVRERIGDLPAKTREAMLLFYVEGYSINETARCLGARESAVKKRLQYGRELVGEQLWADLREKQDRDDSKSQKAKILMALPIAAAPWLKAGTASGVAIIAENIPLLEDREERVRLFASKERELAELTLKTLNEFEDDFDFSQDFDDFDFHINYKEPEFPLNVTERIARDEFLLRNGLIRPWQIWMRDDPDRFSSEDEARKIWEKERTKNQSRTNYQEGEYE